MLNDQNRTCSDGEIDIIIKIFEKCNVILESGRFKDDKGNISYGFYLGLLSSTKYETDPKLFFQLLEIDEKIGWANPDHVEETVFYYKGIKIIEDQNVSLKKKITFQTRNFS